MLPRPGTAAPVDPRNERRPRRSPSRRAAPTSQRKVAARSSVAGDRPWAGSSSWTAGRSALRQPRDDSVTSRSPARPARACERSGGGKGTSCKHSQRERQEAQQRERAFQERHPPLDQESARAWCRPAESRGRRPPVETTRRRRRKQSALPSTSATTAAASTRSVASKILGRRFTMSLAWSWQFASKNGSIGLHSRLATADSSVFSRSPPARAVPGCPRRDRACRPAATLVHTRSSTSCSCHRSVR